MEEKKKHILNTDFSEYSESQFDIICPSLIITIKHVLIQTIDLIGFDGKLSNTFTHNSGYYPASMN